MVHSLLLNELELHLDLMSLKTGSSSPKPELEEDKGIRRKARLEESS